MTSFVPSEKSARREMLDAIGLRHPDELYRDIPEEVMLESLDLPSDLSEAEAEERMESMAQKNQVFKDIYRGAGAFRHYIPALCRSIPGKESFLTAYTPYQAELSQGILQIIFEFQTEVSELFGLPCANASLYDGATAAAEALNMCRTRRKTRCLIAATADPQYIEVCRTYAAGLGAELDLIPQKDGLCDLDAMAEMLDKKTAGVFIPQLNFNGLIEDLEAAAALVHEAKALLVAGIHPIAAALLQSAGEAGADIAVGEGQVLGLPLGFGGPYIGLMACTQKLLRSMPGRIVGQTEDADGKRAFVLTLQAREQHIRREKATSNICTNQALCALTNTVYLAALGKEGLKETAAQCTAKAHYLAEILDGIGFKRVHEAEFFNEFLTTAPLPGRKVNKILAEAGILGPLLTEENGEERLLWCATECNKKQDMDRMAEILKEAVK